MAARRSIRTADPTGTEPSRQHVDEPGWSPTGPLGTNHGKNAANNVGSVGFPPGVNVWLDLEGVNAGASAQAVSDHRRAG